MTTIKDRNQTNKLINKAANSSTFTVKENVKLQWSFWLSIISFIGLLITICIAIAALAIALKDENKINLFSQAVSESRLVANTEYSTMYTYYTQANDKTLQNYSGEFEVTVNDSSAIDFIVTDQNDVNITGAVSKGANNLPTIIPFKTNGKPSELKINYKTASSSISLRRIDLNLD
jgi:hypothetical protein